MACLSLSACDGAPYVIAGPDVASVAEDGLVLSLDATPQTISPGDTVRIEVTLRNATGYAIRLEAGGCPILHYIENAVGEIVVPEGGGWYCITILQSITLGPGETREYSARWTGESCAWVDGQRHCAPLPTGEYAVYATFDAAEDGRAIALRTPDIRVVLER